MHGFCVKAILTGDEIVPDKDKKLTFEIYCHTSALIVLLHNDRSVVALIHSRKEKIRSKLDQN